MMTCNRKQWGIFYVSIVFALALALIEILKIDPGTKLSVLDIGQGDAILIRTAEGRNVLIDAGPDGRVVEQLGQRLGFFDKTIDLFVLTHPHLDHFGGFFDLAKQYDVRRALLTGVSGDNPLYFDLINFLNNKKIEIVFSDSATDWQIGRNLYLDVLYPFAGQSLVGQVAGNLNNTSVVIRLAEATPESWRPLAMLPGDAEREEEREILMSGQDVRSPILKAGHHGSRTSTSEPFLRAVNPQRVVISAGKDNQFGHPHPETLEKLKEMEYWVTAVGGSKVFVLTY